MADPTQKTLLLVEDEVLIAQAERLALEGYGYRVLIAGTGEKAIEMVRVTPGIDLVLMDIDLGPGIDGTEAAARILKDHDLPVVFLSSHTEPVVVEKVERITSYGYVVKDSSYVVLNASIRMAFRLFEANRAVRLSHETYKGMINSVTEAIYVQDERGVFLDINERSMDFYGIPSTQVIGRTPDFLAAPGINDLARKRKIVIHSAEYVDPIWIQLKGGIGRSYGCPAVRPNIINKVVENLKDGQFLFSYYPDRRWLNESLYLNCSPDRVAAVVSPILHARR